MFFCVATRFCRGRFLRRCSQWSAALKEAQAQHDAFIVGDWGDTIDWAALGLEQPGAVPPTDARSAVRGRSQELPGLLDRFGPEWRERGEVMRRHGLIPEYYLSGYVPFLMDVAVHPHMEALHRLMLFGDEEAAREASRRSERIVWNHCHLLSRSPGYAGGPWHSHPNRDGTDGVGVAHSLDEYERRGLNVIFTFACKFF